MAKHDRYAPLPAVTPLSESAEANEAESLEIIELASAELDLLTRAFDLIAAACADDATAEAPAGESGSHQTLIH
jgi:hypothetical protein